MCLGDEMNIFQTVVESPPSENTIVVHRRLRLPKEDYYRHIAGYEENRQEAAQLFVRDYLAARGEQEGVLGMVRSWEAGDWIAIEATLRYPPNPT